MTLSLATYLLFLHLCNLAMGNVDSSPRMIFTEKGRKGKCFFFIYEISNAKKFKGTGKGFFISALKYAVK